jgi:hypothetical protein
MWHKSIGDISKSKFWISVARRPWAWWRWGLSFGPTYNGTVRGICLMLPCLVVLGHQRDTRLNGVTTK